MVDQTPILTIAICTYSRADLLPWSLQSIAAQSADASSFELLIIDNNSTDHTQQVIASFQDQHPDLSIRNIIETEVGLSAARNRAVREAAADWIAFLDDDAKAPPTWVTDILSIIQTAPQELHAFGGGYQPFYESPKPAWFIDALGASQTPTEMLPKHRDAHYMIGCNYIIRCSAVGAAGGFDNTFGQRAKQLGRGEETLLLLMLWKQFDETQSWIGHYPNLIVEHYVAPERMTFGYQLRLAYQNGRCWGRLLKVQRGKLVQLQYGTKSLIAIPYHLIKSIVTASPYPGSKGKLFSILHPIWREIGLIRACLVG